MIEPKAVVFDLPERRRRGVLSLAPLINLTFILLILFVLAAQFDRFAATDIVLGGGEVIQLAGPDSETADAVKGLVVKVSANGGLSVGGRDGVAMAELASILQDQLGDAPPQSATPLIAIAPEPDAPLQILIDVVSAVQRTQHFKTRIIVPEAAGGAGER